MLPPDDAVEGGMGTRLIDDIDFPRQVGFAECVSQSSLHGKRQRGVRDDGKVEIGIAFGPLLDAAAKCPDGVLRDVCLQDVLHDAQVLGADIEGGFRHCVFLVNGRLGNGNAILNGCLCRWQGGCFLLSQILWIFVHSVLD